MEQGGTIDYAGLVLRALRGAVATLLADVARHGLPGDHHFYITFQTDAEGVSMPESLRREYPEEITIVLQNQFWNLDVEPDAMTVDLRFGGAPVTLRVPFASITAFADPSADFGLQLGGVPPDEVEEPDTPESPPEEVSGEADSSPADGSATVIDFDAERRRR